MVRRKLNVNASLDPITVSIRTSCNHLARHLEQLALLVFPKQELVEHKHEIGDPKAANEDQVRSRDGSGIKKANNPRLNLTLDK